MSPVNQAASFSVILPLLSFSRKNFDVFISEARLAQLQEGFCDRDLSKIFPFEHRTWLSNGTKLF